jgi:hypothetical protein
MGGQDALVGLRLRWLSKRVDLVIEHEDMGLELAPMVRKGSLDVGLSTLPFIAGRPYGHGDDEGLNHGVKTTSRSFQNRRCRTASPRT